MLHPTPVTVDSSSDSSTGYGVGDLVAGRYLIRSELGRGGMGAVYEVEHVKSGQRLALKTLYPRFGKIPEIMKRFEREAKATNLLSHPHIVEVLDFGALDSGAPFLVMEVLRGNSLGNLIDKGPIEPVRGLRIISQVLAALTHAHAVGIVHRDLKPDNVMLVVTGSSGKDFVKLLDFGIAKVVGEAASEVGSDSLTLVGTAFGTPEYMAPEQALGVPVDHRADLYATGILLFEVLTGHQPFRGPDPMTIARMQVQNKPPTLREALPDHEWSDELEQVLDRALAKLPDERYQSAKDMLEAIDGLIETMQAAPDSSSPVDGSSAVTTLEPARRPALAAPGKRSWKSMARVGLPALILVAIAAVVLLVSSARKHRARPGAAPGATAVGPPRSELAQQAERKLDSGDARGALEMLEGGLVAPAGERDAYGQFLLGRARTVVGAHAEAVKAYALATSLAPELLDSKVLRGDLATILKGKDKTAALRALELLAERPVPGAEDLVVEQASSGKLREVRQRARAIARQKGVLGRVDELESYSLDLEQGLTCAKRREAVGKLRTLGRKEAIPALQKAAQLRPNACLEKDAAAAIRYLEGQH